MHQRLNISVEDSKIIYVSRTELNEDFRSIQHAHDNLEVLLITEGKGLMHARRELTELKKQQMVIINPKAKHYEIGAGKMTFYAIGLRDSAFLSDDPFSQGIVRCDTGEEYPYLYRLFESIFREAEKRGRDYDRLIRNNTDSILLTLSRAAGGHCMDTADPFDSDTVALLKNYIDLHFMQPFRLEDLANLASVSVSSICHQFKNETGESILQYKLKRQLEEARNLICISDMSMVQISIFVGFNSQSYFTRLYREKFGETPKETRSRKEMEKEEQKNTFL